MKRAKKNGYTLVELLVVLAIMGIILAIAVPSFISYWRKAEFRKNESNAKTIYLAAESKLTYYRSSGQWKQFKKEVKKQGEAADFFSGEDVSLNGRIYAITLDSNEYKDTDKKKNAVLKLLDDYIYDKDLMKGSIGIEIDIETGEVYSAFYGTKCKGLTYKDEDADGYLTMQKRDYESRSKRLLGYYSTEDTTNVVSLKPKKLRITTISLHNSEKLSLNWSSNAGYSQVADYEVTFYKKDKQTKLFSLVVSPYKMATKGWKGTNNSTANMASLEVKDANGNSKGNWTFPVTYSDNKYSLVLDGIMSAKVQEALNEKSGSEKIALERTYSTSICRLADVNKSLASAQDICATVRAVPFTGDNKKLSSEEWRESESVFSNSANSMYADNSKGNDVKIAAFRHLSNIRYYTGTGNTTFLLTNKNMDWTAVGTGVYDFVSNKNRANDVQLLAWKENNSGQIFDFPTIATLDSNYTLKGEGSQTLISNLKLGEESIVDGKKYLGLFGEVFGEITTVTLQNAALTLAASDSSYDSVQATGIVAGRSEGNLQNISVTSDKSNVEVTLTNETQAAVGGIVGMFAKGNGGQLSRGTCSNVSMEGTVKGTLPSILMGDEQSAETNIAGIGGVVGYANLKNGSNTVITKSKNHAEVSGNFMTGGIVGKIQGSYRYNNNVDASQANIKSSSNDGLILCTAEEGKYFGGIAGYGFEVLIHESASASGRASGFSFVDSDGSPKRSLLKGTYVGGIAGYGVNTLINNCSTEKDGYILGADFVGGIAGGLTGEAVSEAIRADSIVSVTTNASYVIGNNYIGGIVGCNENKVTLQNCVNNGVAAGYEKYVGGIVGFNEHGAKIENCASYLSDYDNSVFNMIVGKWKATGSYAGGIAGYNNGEIDFSRDSQAITVKSVSSIVVGQDYVGGIAGFNDTEGTLDVHYTLIGGRIYGYGNCVGGGFGLNASTDLLTKELTIRPGSVEGKYYVGGCIGANVVNLPKDITMNKFKTDNILGSISGDAYVGGIIGYQRTYSADQLAAGKDGAILDAVASTTNLLPGIAKGNVPGEAFTTKNTRTLTVSTNGNSATSLEVSTNNISLRGSIYVGGIIGYADKSSHLIIKNCKNAGSISKRTSGTDRTVTLKNYTRKESGLNLAANLENPSLHLVGGIISANLENHVIDHCTNTGSMSGYSGTGGVVGLNAGLVYNCELSEHFGNATLNYLGGIAGINVGDNNSKRYGSGTSTLSYKAGTIQKCSTLRNKTISGKNNVGGIVGWNLTNGILKEDTSYANLTSSGNNVGGIAGRNSGTIIVASNTGNVAQRISSSGNGIGGIAGINEIDGTLEVKASGTSDEVIAVGTGVSVNGYEKVGGIVGINYGTMGSATQSVYLVNKAKQVRASHGTVGGVVGESDGNITKTINRGTTVNADSGTAGGITALNATGKVISECINYGDVRSSNGYVGGITAENKGTIRKCSVTGKETGATTIYSLGVDEIGAVNAVNVGTIEDSKVSGSVTLRGDATKFGGITGSNEGVVQNTNLTDMPEIAGTKTNLTVGGAVGENLKTVTGIHAKGLNFNNFSGYMYLGGIVGINGNTGNNTADVTDCAYSGTIKEKTSAAGNCYGGIAGINYATLQNDNIGEIHMTIQGVYTATSTSTAQQKEAAASHAGGIAGKNEDGALIFGCTLENNANSNLTAYYGMLGGVTGFNKGNIQMSGSSITENVMNDADTADKLVSNAKTQGLSADSTYINSGSSKQVENLRYSSGTGTSAGSSTTVSDGRLQMYMNTNGNIGGIVAYNGTTGAVNDCVAGKWFLVNKSEAIGVGTGGMIGMNESENNLSRLVNGAFVGRQLSNADTNRFAGGIIGNQNNSTSSDWTIDTCINFGTVYCYNTHYSGGIMGQWTGSGGNIENCRNYGNLQTTYGTAWVGASGGIVAQLYHAYEENDYNIIGCENHGSIYTRNGTGYGNGEGANDSAGILGNITTFQVSSADNAPQFSVRILDCLNAPGVQIYSSSMASGIFGFMSCDNPSASNISNSTCKVKIQVERCRNYAKILKGNQFVGGIFGARYQGWVDNTIVKDCYSLNLGSSQYYSGYNGNSRKPIYSNGITTNESVSSPSKMVEANADNGKNNIFYDGIGNGNNKNIGYFGNNVILGIENADKSITKGSGSDDVRRATSAYYIDILSNTQIIKKADGKYVVAQINSNISRIDGAKCYIDTNGYIQNGNGSRIGQVLYEVGDEQYPNHDNIYYIGSEQTEPSRNLLAYNSRLSYKRLEGITKDTSGKEKLEKPIAAAANVNGGKIKMTVTPAALPNDPSSLSDPFAYRVMITDDNGNTREKMLYRETESFDIPEGLSGSLTMKVQAVSMFDDVADSTAVTVNVTQDKEILPSPDVRAELIVDQISTWKKDYRYKFSLNNLEDYAKYDGWQVTVYINAYGKDKKAVLNAENPTGVLTDLNLGDDGQKKRNSLENTYQIIAQATGTKYADSPVISTAAYMPYFQAFMSLKTPKSGSDKVRNVATTNVSVSGNTLDTLDVNVSLDNSSSNTLLEVTPIYRAELIGNWKDGTDTVVFAKTDIMTVSKGVATAHFTNLPEYLKDAKNLKVRLWYAQMGLGPVYLYHDMISENDGSISSAMSLQKGLVKELVDVKDGKETWAYSYSTTLNNEWEDYYPYMYTTDNNIFTWIAAPDLDQKDGSSLTPIIDEATGKLQYKFSWDKNVSNGKYEISLTGIDADGKQVTIDASDYDGSNSYTADSDEWTYTQVHLKVTRIGDESKRQIGLSTTATYNVSQRLEKPEQPAVEIVDQNELYYNIFWSPITSETSCAGYQAYIRTYDGSGNLGNAEKIGNLIKVSEKKDGSYKKKVNLENYAGKRAVICLVAVADASGKYLDSAEGITYELQIPRRLDAPKVTWNKNWTYDSTQPIDAKDFENGGMTIGLTADDASVPPGGSAYLLKAYVYNSKVAAEKATISDPGDSIAEYPGGDIPIQMDMLNSHNYSHDIQGLSIKYAGKWIVFYTRISSGSGNVSSDWTKIDMPVQLPYVKLAEPDVISKQVASTDEDGEKLQVKVTDNPDLPPIEQEWDMTRTHLTWESVDCANLYSIDLAGKLTTDNSTKDMNDQVRVIETKDADGKAVTEVQQYVYVERQKPGTTDPKDTEWVWIWKTVDEVEKDYPEGTKETDKIHTYKLNEYQVNIEDSYSGQKSYTLTIMAELDVQIKEDGGFSYTLKLPDITDVKAMDGQHEMDITHDNFNVTTSVKFKSNVTDNLDGNTSDAYIESKEKEVKFTN